MYSKGSTLLLFNEYSQGINAVKEGDSEIKNFIGDLRICTFFLAAFKSIIVHPFLGLGCAAA